MKTHFSAIIVSIGMSIFMFASCTKNSCSNSEKATFKDATGTDGCKMMIELSNGKFLEPKNLSDFSINVEDGKKIWVSYHLATTGGTVCMMGDVVVIDCITER